MTEQYTLAPEPQVKGLRVPHFYKWLGMEALWDKQTKLITNTNSRKRSGK